MLLQSSSSSSSSTSRVEDDEKNKAPDRRPQKDGGSHVRIANHQPLPCRLFTVLHSSTCTLLLSSFVSLCCFRFILFYFLSSSSSSFTILCCCIPPPCFPFSLARLIIPFGGCIITQQQQHNGLFLMCARHRCFQMPFCLS